MPSNIPGSAPAEQARDLPEPFNRRNQDHIMYAANRMRQYQQQAIVSSSPEQLILKLYDLGIQCCLQGNRSKLRAVLAELVGSLNFEDGGELAERLYSLYDYCITESVSGDLEIVRDVISGLREAWKQGVVSRKAA